jgi:Na+/H+ antiporter NhaC
MKIRLLFSYLVLCTVLSSLNAQNSATPLQEFEIKYENNQLLILSGTYNGPATIEINKEPIDLTFENGRAYYPMTTDREGQLLFLKVKDGPARLYHIALRKDSSVRLRPIPLWLSILSPLIAILMALLFREVVLSLFVGIWTGAFIAGGLRLDSFGYFLGSIGNVVEKYIVGALSDAGHLSIILFSLLIGGMVAIISRNGGMAGIVDQLSRYAKSAKSSQLVTWILGVAIFFDDYANTLIVGNTMRSVTDKFKVSREKLAYIVDSTAAPVAAIAFITTWIGAELGYIGDGIATLENFDGGTPYSIFLSSLKYSFYPVLTLGFILIIIYTGRDFGPMLKAERRARTTGQVAPTLGKHDDLEEIEDLSPVKGAPHNWYNAFIPVLLVILTTILGLLVTGFESTHGSLVDSGISVASPAWGDVWPAMTEAGNQGFFMKLGVLIGNSDSYVALIWASLTGVIVAILLTLTGRIMRLIDTMNTMITGFKTMLPALIILTLAWALAITTQELFTADFLSMALQDSLPPQMMPVIVFILAALIAFSTGSSWSTMAILYPLAIPITWTISQSQGLDPDLSMELLFNSIAVVLAASVLGDHCSPISDTTILSSLASDCNHIDHVRTQMPYALLVGGFSLACGGLSTLLGGGWLICTLLLIISFVLLYFVIMRIGKKSEA